MTTTAASPARLARAVLAWRVFVVLVGIFFLFVAPLVRQVLGVHSLPSIQWRMFEGKSLDQCAVEYRQILDDGTSVRLDRRAVLDYSEARPPSKGFRSLTTEDQVIDVGHQLCKKLSAREIRASFRCASYRRDGWVERMDGTRDVCTMTRAAKPALPRRERRGTR